MKAKHLLFLLLSVVAFHSPVALAQNPQCYGGPAVAGGIPWNPSLTHVKVYIHRTTQTTLGPGQGLRFALRITIPDEQRIEYSVIRAIHLLNEDNEEGGGKLKLQFAGYTSSSSDPNDSIVLRSSDPPCANFGQAGASVVAVNGYRSRGRIIFRESLRQGGSTCNIVNWQTSETSGIDLVTTLLHELGHAFYDVGHPDLDGCPFTPGTQTVMNSG